MIHTHRLIDIIFNSGLNAYCREMGSCGPVDYAPFTLQYIKKEF